jgi:hypothetical protein
VIKTWVELGPSQLIDNVKTELRTVSVGEDSSLEQVLITVNDSEFENSHVCSVYSLYVRFGAEKLESVLGKWLALPVAALNRMAGIFFRTFRMDRVVCIDNWLFATPLHPRALAAAIPGITRQLSMELPSHALFLKGVDSFRGPGLSDSLVKSGYLEIPTREVYYIDPARRTEIESRNHYRADLRKLRASPYNIRKARLGDDVERLLSLYRQLYLDKHTLNNPQFNERFFSLCLSGQLLNLEIFEHRENGSIDAMLGFYEKDGVRTYPVLGYATELPKAAALYRMMNAHMIESAFRDGVVLNQSSGAGRFKTNRGAVPVLESNFVYVRHLPFYRRLAWHGFSVMMRKFMKSYLSDLSR